MLEVKIKAPAGGPEKTLRFSQSPVRIGRNQLNDISLQDPFVSEWHGIIRFDQRNIAYFDLGSTNGTILEGKRLTKNVAMELSDTSLLQLGLLELTVARVETEPAPVAAPRRPQTGPHKTMAWGYSPSPSPAPASMPVLGDAAVAGGMAPSGSIDVDLSLTPPPASARSGGDLGRSSAVPGHLPAMPSGPAANGEAALLARHAKLLEAFGEAFIGLRKGYEQFGAEVGVRTINGSTPLHRARTRAEVVDYLLQPSVDPEAAARDLIAIFADFGIHHIAMMEGVTESVRTMLQALDPRANDLEDAAPRLFSGAKLKHQWKAYLERFDQMATDDNELHAAVFGDEFARAYASVTVGDDGKRNEGDD
ncbi:MAG TPA: type VI secretion system-associated FHA domain protein [Polyangia bacterium]|nr:type VI secretion system-associated FHA domain protein [Polyangia bacterium]